MKVVVIGNGAMGKLFPDLLKENLICNVSPSSKIKNLDSIEEKFDVIIDFSNPDNLDMIYNYISKTKIPIVIGTTGFNENQNLKIKKLSEIAPVLISSNFSLGKIILNKLVKEITPILNEDFDIEIVEAHHNKKKDAPSGTAKMLLNSVKESKKDNEIKFGREGNCLRKKNEIGIHSIRGGTIVGEHKIIYAGTDEVLSLNHSAQSKIIFAKGAIKAAKWLINQKPGFYNFENVLFN